MPPKSHKKAAKKNGNNSRKRNPLRAPPSNVNEDVVPGVCKLVLRADKTSNYLRWKEEMEKYLFRHFQEVGHILRSGAHHVVPMPTANAEPSKKLKKAKRDNQVRRTERNSSSKMLSGERKPVNVQ